MATVPLLSRKVSSVQKVNTAMSNLVYYSSQKKYTHLQVILFSFLFRIWTPLSFLLDKDYTLCSGMELVTRVFYSPYPWILLKISKFYVQQNDKELLIIKLFGALLILPFHDIPVFNKAFENTPLIIAEWKVHCKCSSGESKSWFQVRQWLFKCSVFELPENRRKAVLFLLNFAFIHLKLQT